MVHEIDGFSALGPAGFIGNFFTHCWDIVGPYVCRAVQEFFVTRFLEPGMNFSNIVLLP